jgi:transcriptional regulator with XRE-family HTH domain
LWANQFYPTMEYLYIEEGKRVKMLAVASGLTGTKIARLTNNGIRASRWTEYCQGKRLITVEAAILLSDLTGATLDYIYRGDLSGLPERLRDKIAACGTAQQYC